MQYFVKEIQGFGAVFLKQPYKGVRKRVKMVLKSRIYLTYLPDID